MDGKPKYDIYIYTDIIRELFPYISRCVFSKIGNNVDRVATKQHFLWRDISHARWRVAPIEIQQDISIDKSHAF